MNRRKPLIEAEESSDLRSRLQKGPFSFSRATAVAEVRQLGGGRMSRERVACELRHPAPLKRKAESVSKLIEAKEPRSRNSASPTFRQLGPTPTEASAENEVFFTQSVREQLARILQSKGFASARRMRKFLEFVVEETLSGRGDALCEYSIATSVFERGESFSPGLDPIVRNDARRLRQKLLEYYAGLSNDLDRQIRIDLPKGGYVPVFRTATIRKSPANERKFRFVASLIHLENGAEIWSTERDFQIDEGSETPFFSCKFECSIERHPKIEPISPKPLVRRQR